MGTADSAFGLMLWPWQAARLGADWAETMMRSQRVIGARLPLIAEVARDPFDADHRELTRMGWEKAQALAESGEAALSAGRSVRRAAEANAAAIGGLAGGRALWPADWLRLIETNLAAAVAVSALPAAALAPVHRRVVANDRRLGRSSKRRPRNS